MSRHFRVEQHAMEHIFGTILRTILISHVLIFSCSAKWTHKMLRISRSRSYILIIYVALIITIRYFCSCCASTKWGGQRWEWLDGCVALRWKIEFQIRSWELASVLVTLNDLEDHLLVAGLFKCNPSNICAAFYQISTDSMLTQSLGDSRASC